jgi:pimeloyl-ACP methyl ester carboxylesterase
MIFRRLLGKLISHLVMPAQFNTGSAMWLVDKFSRESRVEGDLNIAFNTVDSTGDAKISFCEISKIKIEKEALKDQKIIIHASGNGSYYERHFDDYKTKAQQFPGCKIVGFNFRNVISSKGSAAYTEDQWIDDVIAVINYYRKQGVPTENILLNGQSLGAAIVTMAAAKLLELDRLEAKNKNLNANEIAKIKSVKLLNGRSFSSLTEEILFSILNRATRALLATLIYGALIFAASFLIPMNAALMANIVFNIVSTAWWFNKLPTLLRPWVNVALWSSFGTMDALSAYMKLDEDSRDYVMAKGDSIITEPSSLHQGLKDLDVKKKIKEKCKVENISPEERALHVERFLNYKTSKLSYTMGDDNAHNAPLVNCYNLNWRGNKKLTLV